MPRVAEDTLLQETVTDYLRDTHGFGVAYAYNGETFGTEITLGRKRNRRSVKERLRRV